MGKYILVIEPSRTINNILGVHLQLADHTVMAFATYRLASDAFPVFQRRPPDVVFIALHLAQPDSCNLLKQARTLYPDATLVALVLPEEHTHRTIQTVLQETHTIALIKPFKIQEALAICGSEPPLQPQRAICN